MCFAIIYMSLLWLVFSKTFLSREPSKILGNLTWGILGIITLLYIILSTSWYHETASFHWFDDGGEWLGMDKLGHFFSTALISRTLIYIYTEAGAQRERCVSILSWSGFLLWSPIEYYDGCSADYGASAWDLAANFLGSAFIYIQFKYFSNIRLFSKLGYFPDAISQLRPSILGATPAEAFLKNYNAQTYWFSIPIKNIFPAMHHIPNWLCISFGYGAEGMTGGHRNSCSDGSGNFHVVSDTLRHSQWYISLDIIPEIKPTHHRITKSLLYIISVFKFPFPALEFNTGSGIHFHIISI